jgi:hypothetical protein
MRTVLCLVALAGCGATIRTSLAPTANLGEYRTYSFATQPATLTDQTIHQALRRELAAKGLFESPPGQPPDFLVDYQTTAEKKLATHPVGWGYYGYAGTQVSQFIEGTLTISFVDPRTRNVFWRGTATDVVRHPESPDLHRVDKVVGQVLQRYPVAAVRRTRM